MALIRYRYSDDVKRDDTFQVLVGGEPVDVLAADEDAFAAFGLDGPSEIEVELPIDAAKAEVRPRSLQLRVERRENRLRFALAPGTNAFIDLMPGKSLFIYANPVEQETPTGPGVRTLQPGRLYREGIVELKSNKRLHIPGGTVLQGQIRAVGATNVHLSGFGVLDGARGEPEAGPGRLLIFDTCRDVRIEGITMIRSMSWTLVLGDCDGVAIRGIRQITHGHGSDGIDVVGSRRVLIQDCMLRNGDDNIAVKSLDLRRHSGVINDYTKDVSDVEVTRCAVVNDLGGSSMEIGHELRCESIRDVRFRDIDVMGVHRFGAVFGIHNADHATVSDVLWENIRVEHFYDRLISFRVILSRWAKDAERGYIRRIQLRDIDVTVSDYNPGYSHSLIGGYDADHLVEDVHISNLRLNGRRTTNIDDIELYVRHARGVSLS